MANVRTTGVLASPTVGHKSRHRVYYVFGIAKLIRELGPHLLFKRRWSAAKSERTHLFSTHQAALYYAFGITAVEYRRSPRAPYRQRHVQGPVGVDCVIECATINTWNQETLSPVKKEEVACTSREKSRRGCNAPKRKCGNGRQKEQEEGRKEAVANVLLLATADSAYTRGVILFL